MDGVQAPPTKPQKSISPEERAALHRRMKKDSEREATETVKRARGAGPKTSVAASNPKTGPTLTRGDSITLTPVSWLWRGWLARGKLHVMAGAPGCGKTTLAVNLAAIVTKGGTWPDGTQAAAGDVLIWSGEDDPQDTLAPRLLAAGAAMERVHFIGEFIDDQGPRSFDPATDVYSLNRLLSETKLQPSLLIVDPLVSAVSADSHKNAEVRRSLAPLVDLAQHRHCAVLGISHFSKGTQGRDPTERVTGSLAFGALARVVFAVAKIQDHEGGGRILVRSKNNLGPDNGGFRFDLESYQLQTCHGIYATRVVWGEALAGTAREILSMAEAETDQEEKNERSDAADWLREILKDDKASLKEVKQEGNEVGFSWRTIQRASKELGVLVERSGFGGGCFWSLPDPEKSYTDTIRATKTHTRHTPECGAYGENVARMGNVYESTGTETAPDEEEI
jgi:putative DNA primase/helicase